MASEKQIAANRANAKRSTGPKTLAGKMKSSRNALRHALSCRLPLDPLASEKLEALLNALVRGQPDHQQLSAAAELAEAEWELWRIRAARARMLLDLECRDPHDLRRLQALDRYERYARTKRRIASYQL
jgi:hypothetical protein